MDEGFLLISEARRSYAGRTPAACRVPEAYSFRRRAYLLRVHRGHGSRFAIGHSRGRTDCTARQSAGKEAPHAVTQKSPENAFALAAKCCATQTGITC